MTIANGRATTDAAPSAAEFHDTLRPHPPAARARGNGNGRGGHAHDGNGKNGNGHNGNGHNGHGRNGNRAIDRDALASQLPWLRGVARNLVRDPWGAEDVAQETLLAALAAPPRDVSTDQRLRAWLGRVAFNLSRLGSRQDARRHAREVRVARSESLPSVCDEVVERAGVRDLMRAVASLAEVDRRILMLRYFDGLSTAEIAADTGLSELAVRKRAWRARARLRTVLERKPRGQALAAFLPLVLRRALPRPAALARLAAGLALTTGAALWVASEHEAPQGALAADLAALTTGARTDAAPVAGGSTRERGDAPSGPDVRVPVAPDARRSAPPPPRELGPRVARVEGRVLDLTGAPRAGLELHDARAPGRVLATSDRFGRFELGARDVPARIVARGDGWATVVTGGPAPEDDARLLPVLVAGAADLVGRVYSSAGGLLADARLTLLYEETAFVDVPARVYLDASVPRETTADHRGTFVLPALPRAPGLVLLVEHPGHDALRVATTELGATAAFTLEVAPTLAALTGRVVHRDGRPAGGALVRLGLRTTRTGPDGAFALSLEDAADDSTLSAQSGSARSVPVRDFGARARDLRGPVEIVLGPPRDVVHGKLLGAEEGGWLVAAYAEDEDQAGDAEAACADGSRPAATTRSLPGGGFTLELPQGAYTLYAVAPAELAVASASGLDTRAGRWTLPLPERTVAGVHGGSVRDAHGRAAANAAVTVLAHLDSSGRRSLPWGVLTTDASGAFAFAVQPGAAYSLATPAGQGTLERPLLRAGPATFRPAPAALLRVAGASGASGSGTLLDAHGRALEVAGPLGTQACFSLRGGASAVLEVPERARWLRLEEPGGEPRLVPVRPRAGETLELVP